MRCTVWLTLLGLVYVAPTALADSTDYPYWGRPDFRLSGLVRAVDRDHARVTVESDSGHHYTVDTDRSNVLFHSFGTAQDREGRPGDLERGMRVRIVGTLVSQSLLEADRVRVLSLSELPAPAPIVTLSLQSIALEGVIRSVDADHHLLTVTSQDDHRYTIDTVQTDIVLPGLSRAGTLADLPQGTPVHLSGTLLSPNVIAADRVRVLPPPEAVPPPAPLPPAPRPVIDLDKCTGVLIDARDLPILRGMSPEVFGPVPGQPALYPDPAHVPSPDEVQDESVVRYYRTVEEGQKGVGGDAPLILHAIAIVGPAKGSVKLSDEDAALFNALDKRLHYTRNWKVGFLIPADK